MITRDFDLNRNWSHGKIDIWLKIVCVIVREMHPTLANMTMDKGPTKQPLENSKNFRLFSLSLIFLSLSIYVYLTLWFCSFSYPCVSYLIILVCCDLSLEVRSCNSSQPSEELKKYKKWLLHLWCHAYRSAEIKQSKIKFR